jgi:hypothetical protein
MDMCPLGVCHSSLVFELSSLEVVSEQRSRSEQLVTSDNGNFLPVEELLGNNRSQSAKQVALSIDNQFFLKHTGLLTS